MNLWAVFLTGLLTGGLTCLALQGGLLAALLAAQKESRTAFSILVFLGSKLVAYTILGLLLGLLGSFFQLSLGARAILQMAVAVFMIGTALNLLQVHPVFRYFVVAPPRFLTRLVRNQTKSSAIFAPAILGAFTVLIPCGTTQAMMAQAVASGNSLSGAAILFTFVLGTSPLFFVLGYLATQLSEVWHRHFLRVAALSIIFLAVFNLRAALALSGVTQVAAAAWREVYCTVSFCNTEAGLLHNLASDTVNIEFTSTGYVASQATVRAGSEVTLNLINREGRGCIQAFTIPQLGVQQIVPVGTTKTITFAAPKTPGTLSYMCSMGMFQGQINVI